MDKNEGNTKPPILDVFNVGKDPDQSKQIDTADIKTKAEELLLLIRDRAVDTRHFGDPELEGEKNRRYALAKTHLEIAVMFAIKALYVARKEN